jgi:oligopeptide transport system substrate-binding protein
MHMENLTLPKSRRLAYLLAAFSLVLFTACGGNDNNNTPANSGAATSETGKLADQQALHLSMNSEPSTIDPQLTSVGNEVSIARQLSTGLFAYDESLNIVPALAKEVPTLDNGGISQDGLTYTIQLKDSKWSDGSPLTANDFVYSMLRELDPNLASPSSWAFYDIAGAADYNASLDVEEGQPAPPASEVDDLRSKVGVKAEGDNKIVYSLEQPDPSFLNILALVSAVPVKQSAIEQYGDAWTDPGNFIGNGPFTLTSWDRGSKITLGRNDNWYGPKPTLTSIEVSFIADDAVAYNAYVNGELDVVRASTASLASGANKDQLVESPELSTYGLFMNNAAAPFDNQKVREAFGSAIDRDAYVSGVLQGAGVPTTVWVPPAMPGHIDQPDDTLSFNPEHAKELLSEAGYPDAKGFPDVNLVMISSDYNTLVSQFIKSQLETNLGVTVTVTSYDQGEYFDQLFEGNFNATIQSWIADWPSPDDFLNLFYTGSDGNFSAYSNPDFDKLLDDAALKSNASDRLDLYNQAQTLLLQDAGLSPLYNEVTNIYVKPSVADLIVTGIDGALKGDTFLWKTKILDNN